MKITDLDYYVLFTFCDVDDDNICFTTSDKNVLNTMKVNNSKLSDFQIGDIINFPPQTENYKIKNIHIRKLVDDTNDYSFGWDKEVSAPIGKNVNPLFSILVSIEKV